MMKHFWKILLAASAAVVLIRWIAHRGDTDNAAEACRTCDDWE